MKSATRWIGHTWVLQTVLLPPPLGERDLWHQEIKAIETQLKNMQQQRRLHSQTFSSEWKKKMEGGGRGSPPVEAVHMHKYASLKTFQNLPCLWNRPDQRGKLKPNRHVWLIDGGWLLRHLFLMLLVRSNQLFRPIMKERNWGGYKKQPQWK